RREPARTESNLKSALAHVVDRDRLLRKKRRMSKRIAAHEDTDSHPSRVDREPREDRPRLEVRAFGPAWLDEMVEVPDTVEPQGFDQTPALNQGRPGQVRIDTDADVQPIRSHASSQMGRLPYPRSASTAEANARIVSSTSRWSCTIE